MLNYTGDCKFGGAISGRPDSRSRSFFPLDDVNVTHSWSTSEACWMGIKSSPFESPVQKKKISGSSGKFNVHIKKTLGGEIYNSRGASWQEASNRRA